MGGGKDRELAPWLTDMEIWKHWWATLATCQTVIVDCAVDLVSPICTNMSSAIIKIRSNPLHRYQGNFALQQLLIDLHYQGFTKIYNGGSKEPTTDKTIAAIYDPSGSTKKGINVRTIFLSIGHRFGTQTHSQWRISKNAYCQLLS